jgi:predicted DNA-binding transcriptional regulator YafY
MTSKETSQVFIQVGPEVIELTGEAKETFEADRQEAHQLALQALSEAEAKELARESALAKLAALGLTEAEIAAL